MSSSKLSDKLINSSRKFVNNFMKHPNVVSIFVTGEAQNDEIGIALYWKDSEYLNDAFLEMCEKRALNAKTVDEKTFYAQTGSSMKVILDALGVDYIKRFGKVADHIQSQPLKKSSVAYHQNMVTCMDGTMDEFIIYLFCIYWIFVESALEMRKHPKFKPNACFDWLYANDYSANMNGVKSVVDSIGDRIDAEEESRLIKLFHHCLQYEIDLFNFA